MENYILWFAVSDAFHRSMKTSQENLLLSKALCICSVKQIKACVVEWLFLKPYWNLKNFSLFSRNGLTCGALSKYSAQIR